jgi:hypothetical protein
MLARKSRMAEESDGGGKAIIGAFGPMPPVDDDTAVMRALEGVRLSFRMPEEQDDQEHDRGRVYRLANTLKHRERRCAASGKAHDRGVL